MKHLDLFSGIGGFALAADRVFGDVEHTFCDNDPFCQLVLKKHWPNSTIHGDIRTLRLDTHTDSNGRTGRSEEVYTAERGQQTQHDPSGRASCIDLLTGGFPCQPFSQAGRRKGTGDDRYLWPEMLRVIREFKPTWVIGENVGGLVTWNDGMVLEQVQADLEAEGYEVQAFIIPACAVNAPHRRDRIWFVARANADDSEGGGRCVRLGKHERTSKREKHTPSHADSDASDTNDAGSGASKSRTVSHREKSRQEREHAFRRADGQDSDAQNTKRKRGGGRVESSRQVLERQSTEVKDARPSWEENWPEVAARLCRVDDGVPKRMDRNPRLKALGNAIVPQVAEEIMRAIYAVDKQSPPPQ